MIRFALALIVGGVALTFFGYNENRLASAADAEPQTISAAELAANGPGDNAHVIINDFEMITWETIVLTPENNEDKYEKVWAPVITFDDPYIEELQSLPENAVAAPPYKGEIKLILYSKDISNAGELESAAMKDTIQGLVINKIDKLSGDELTELRKSLAINPDEVIIIEHNRKPKSAGVTLLMMGGGVLLILAGPALFFFRRAK